MEAISLLGGATSERLGTERGCRGSRNSENKAEGRPPRTYSRPDVAGPAAKLTEFTASIGLMFTMAGLLGGSRRHLS